MAYDVALRIGWAQEVTKMEACCSSPATIRYWFVVSLMAWGVLSLIGIYWRPLHASPTVACLFAMAIGCMIHLDTRWVWPVLLAGVGVAFVLEWLYGKRPVS